MSIVCAAASVGHSVWFSRDRGESWRRAHTERGGVYNESRCWSLSAHSAQPDALLAGTDQGLYRWSHAAQAWRHVPGPFEDFQILKLAQHPSDPDFILAGTRPAELFRSRDGGRSWARLALGAATECAFINTPRVTSIQFDPLHAQTIWVTVEIDGVYRSDDGGDTWRKLNAGLQTPDTHNIAIFDRPEGRRVLCSTELGLHVSLDDGETWSPQPVPEADGRLYFRCLAKRADDGGVAFLSVGDRPSGDEGFLLRTRDCGASWERVDLRRKLGTTIWWIFTNPADPDFLLANTMFGEILRSLDGGETWEIMPKILGEIRETAWQLVAES